MLRDAGLERGINNLMLPILAGVAVRRRPVQIKTEDKPGRSAQNREHPHEPRVADLTLPT